MLLVICTRGRPLTLTNVGLDPSNSFVKENFFACGARRVKLSLVPRYSYEGQATQFVHPSSFNFLGLGRCCHANRCRMTLMRRKAAEHADGLVCGLNSFKLGRIEI
jgi:hypothetical protein